MGLHDIASALVAEGKGVLAADASMRTMNKRLLGIGVEQTEEARRRYRQLLFTTPGIERFLSGVILYDGTMRQSADSGVPFVRLLLDLGIIPGIKVDAGTKEFPNFPHETVTEGLDGLSGRLAEYKDMGAQFAKWRAVIRIGENMPTHTMIDANMRRLAEYAALCQDAGIVSMVEPEVLMDGAHGIRECEEVTTETLITLFDLLLEYKADLHAVILKSNMVLPGKESREDVSERDVAEATGRVLLKAAPKELGGIVFLSGGQTPEKASAHLNEIARLGKKPWETTFSYSRALQEPVMEAWRGDDKNTAEAQSVFFHRIVCNAAAREGKYTKEMEDVNAEEILERL